MWRRPSLTAAVAAVGSLSRRALSTGESHSDETAWRLAMEEKYGAGTHKLFRPLYKDLADEMRRENCAKPPPPLEGWSVRHETATSLVVFERAANEKERVGRIVAYSPIEMGNPPKINDLLYFVDWFPVEVLIARNGVIMHISMATNEGGMHMRNVRMYKEEPSLMQTTDDAAWQRRHLHYDGPCLWHLELELQGELYDVMQDHGVTLEWMRWAAEWVYYLEHVSYVRWSLGMLDELIPAAERGPEKDFLTPSECAALEQPAEEWMESHYA